MLLPGEIIVDSFAGGGGASTGIELALGRSPDIAINHDAEALALHAANHPAHAACLEECLAGRSLRRRRQAARGPVVGIAGLQAFFQSQGRQASQAQHPRPCLGCGAVGEARAASRHHPGKRRGVSRLGSAEEARRRQAGARSRARGADLRPLGGELKRLGYRVEWRELRACDYGAPTIRKRLFLIARCDGIEIQWPEPTHGAPGSEDVIAGRKKPWRTAAEIIDWSLPCPSIFLTREEGRAVGCNRPLAEATMARIAKGVKRYVIDARSLSSCR
jgi:DNA (cytosine-5)-methyltransferase 1